MTEMARPPMAREEPPLMKCGHAANAQDEHGNPVCVICVGITPGATEVDEKPSLEGRVARCGSCRNETPSDWRLAFFRYQPTADHDSFYCGCRGWD